MDGTSSDEHAAKFVCRRLPQTEQTLRFLSPYLAKDHIQHYADDHLRTYYGIYNFMLGIRIGNIRAYGVFYTGDPLLFCGFMAGALDGSGEAFELHAFWDRGADAVMCMQMCRPVLCADFAADGVALSSAVGYIPDCNRAAQRMARKVGAEDKGIRPDKLFWKDGKDIPCREFRFYLKEKGEA